MTDRKKGLNTDGAVSAESVTLFREKVAPLIADTGTADSTEADAALIDLVGCLVHEMITVKQFISFVTSVEFSKSESAKEALADAVWFWGTQISNEAGGAGVKPSNRWTGLCALVKELFILKTVESDRLKKTLELNLLAGSGLWTDEQGLQKRLVKINTSLVYRQDKYNLLREETEGYSKLLTVLGALPPPPEDPSTHVKHIFSVIGYFDLDPNRVLDITLEAMEQQLWNTSYLTLLRMFRRASVAHILGFKLSQYHKCNGAEGAPSPPGTPASLYMLTAVLLTAQVLTLEQIFPYLSPSLEETAVAAAEKRAAQRKEVMGHGSYNLAAKKTDDATKAKSQDLAVDDGAAVSPDVPAAAFADGNQIVGVMAAALTLRSWNLAQDIQAKFLGASDKIDPYDFTSCCDALIALVEWRMAAVYAPIGFPRFSLGRSRVEPNDTSIADVLIPAGLSVAGSTDCGKMEEAGQNGETAGELAYSQCLQVESADVVVQEMMPMLLALGHHLAASPRVFTQLCRLLKSRVSTYGNITSTDEHDELKSIVQLLQVVLLPSLSQLDCNPALTTLCWGVLSLFPFQTRYALYSSWKGDGVGKEGIASKPLAVVYAETRNLHSAKGYLKRLTKENTKQIGRQLAKQTHSCALVVFDYILSQIESYDNMIPFVVDALKYATELAKDVMSYALLTQLRKESNKLKPGDTHYSQWFSALSKFIGVFYKKYPSTELHGLLHYLLDRMSTGESLDLLVLKELLGRMGGCETLLDVSHQQLEGLAGGRSLRGEVMGAQVKDAVSKKAQRILRDTMLSSGTAIPLLLFIAQSRSNILYDKESSQLKLISYLYDTCQDVLMQFTDFLVGSNSKGVESMVDIFPPMRHLLGDVGLNVSVAFQLVRPLIRAALHYGEDPSAAPPELQNWHPFSNEMKDVVCQYLPADVWTAISPQLYLTFWSLSLYDVFVPKAKYEAEIRRLKDRYSELDVKAPPSEDRLASKQRRAEMTKILNLTNTLREEQEAQKKHVEIIRNMIRNNKNAYLSHVNAECAPKSTENIMQYCVYFRVLMSPADAIFCSQFFLNLHSEETPGFSTIHFFDKTMKTLAPLTFCSTEYEAGFLGFYINDMLETGNRWVGSKTTYAKEARAKCGMDKTFGSKTMEGRASYEEFLNVFKIWHKKLGSIITACLKSTEYMHARSALVFLSKVSSQFPSRASAGKAILAGVDAIERDGSKEDLKIMARSLGAIIRKRSSTWVDDDKRATAATVQRTSSAKKSADGVESSKGGGESSKKKDTAPVATKTTDSLPTGSKDARDSSSRKGGEGSRTTHKDDKKETGTTRTSSRDRSRSQSKSKDNEVAASSSASGTSTGVDGAKASRSSTEIAREAAKASVRAKRGRETPAAEESGSGGGTGAESSKSATEDAKPGNDSTKRPAETPTAALENVPQQKRARATASTVPAQEAVTGGASEDGADVAKRSKGKPDSSAPAPAQPSVPPAGRGRSGAPPLPPPRQQQQQQQQAPGSGPGAGGGDRRDQRYAGGGRGGGVAGGRGGPQPLRGGRGNMEGGGRDDHGGGGGGGGGRGASGGRDDTAGGGRGGGGRDDHSGGGRGGGGRDDHSGGGRGGGGRDENGGRGGGYNKRPRRN